MEGQLSVPASSPTLFRHTRVDLFSLHIAIGPDDGVDPQCSDKMVPDALLGNKKDHSGPYNGILIGNDACT